ncbi:hypothetical protein Pcinc_029033 [Petrolisthes cinctipes]|uniref:Uncharacterized protein n=1 Tax=Petrolisthes cinctipes TaxID=88211 RepID=A0AAE1F1V6_PETCI|nr:hypothetical protein Pcinc_029033 [Petrolisthes cinctipes]
MEGVRFLYPLTPHLQPQPRRVKENTETRKFGRYSQTLPYFSRSTSLIPSLTTTTTTTTNSLIQYHTRSPSPSSENPHSYLYPTTLSYHLPPHPPSLSCSDPDRCVNNNIFPIHLCFGHVMHHIQRTPWLGLFTVYATNTN